MLQFQTLVTPRISHKFVEQLKLSRLSLRLRRRGVWCKQVYWASTSRMSFWEVLRQQQKNGKLGSCLRKAQFISCYSITLSRSVGLINSLSHYWLGVIHPRWLAGCLPSTGTGPQLTSIGPIGIGSEDTSTLLHGTRQYKGFGGAERWSELHWSFQIHVWEN